MTPLWGLATVQAKLVIVVVPVGTTLPIPIEEPVPWPGEHTRFKVALRQFAPAPGYRLARPLTMAGVTLMPLTVAGALRVQLHAVGQTVEPGSLQSPESRTENVTPLECAVYEMTICGAAGVVV